MPVAHRSWSAAVALAAAVAILAAGCGRGVARPARAPSASTPPSAPAALRDPVTRKAADALCATESQEEMGTSRLGKLYGARTAGYMTVQRLESQARKQLRAALGGLPVTDADRPALSRLLTDQDHVLTARDTLFGVLAHQPPQGKLALLTGPHEVVGAYRELAAAYLAAGRDFLAAGLPSCATPLITVRYGPGTEEASGATVEFRIAAACRTVSYATDGTTGANTATLGSVMQPGTHKPGDRYDGSAGKVDPPVRADEVIVLTSIHYPVESATCAPATGPASPSSSSSSPPSSRD